MQSIEDIILRDSARGMTKLRPHLPEDFCRSAAAEILSWKTGPVLLTTGFYVAGYAETDGPLGTYVLAAALRKLGYRPVIVTDLLCKGYFEADFEVCYVPVDADEPELCALLQQYSPMGMISVERCGLNARNDYENMRGKSIREHTAPIDLLFRLAAGAVPTVGVGDGGNEIGMGNLESVIREELSLVPCTVKTDHLVIATVSNWGAYGLAAALQQQTGRKLLAENAEAEAFLSKTVALGSVDGISGMNKMVIDGFPFEKDCALLDDLRAL